MSQMPTVYTYKCSKCGKIVQYDHILSYDETECECGGRLRREY